MDTYGKSDAARMLGVSRQTVHRYTKKHPGRYSVIDDAKEERITLRGLEEMRAAIQGQLKRHLAPVTSISPPATSQDVLLRNELVKEQERTKAALDDVTSLKHEITRGRDQVMFLQEKISDLEKLLEQAGKRIDTLEAERAVQSDLLREMLTKIPAPILAEQKASLWARFKAWSPFKRLPTVEQKPPEQPPAEAT